MRYLLDLDDIDVRLIGGLLERQPYRVVAKLMYKIQVQITNQEAAAAEAQKPVGAKEATATAEEASATPPSA